MFEEEYLADNALESAAAGMGEDGAAAVDTEDPAGQALPEGVAAPEGTGEAPEGTPQDTIEKTRAFSARLNEMSARKVDEFVQGLGLINEFDGSPVRTRSDYERYRTMQKAQQQGGDPIVSARLAEMEGKLSRYQEREADERLQADPQQGAIYRELRGEVMQLLDYCRATGRGEVGLEDAYNVVLKNNLPRLLGQTQQKTQQQTVRRIQAAAAASPGPLGAGSPPKALDFASMSDADFEKYEQMALRGQLSKN